MFVTLQKYQLCKSTTTFRSAGNKCSSNGNTRVALSVAHRKWAGHKKRESSLTAGLRKALDPRAVMSAVWRYTSSISGWFITKKLDRITVKFLCFSGGLWHGGKVRGFLFSTLSLFTLITASSKSGPLFAADYSGKKTDFHKWWSYERSPPVSCFYAGIALTCKQNMLKCLKCENIYHERRLWFHQTLGNGISQCWICHPGQGPD